MLPCPISGCPRRFKSQKGRTYHVRSIHENTNIISPGVVRSHSSRPPTSDVHESTNHETAANEPSEANTPPPAPCTTPPLSPQSIPHHGQKIYHPFLNGRPCDADGNFLPDQTPPLPRTQTIANDWSPYEDDIQFRTADLLYQRVAMSAGNIDYLMELWALSMLKHNDTGPFKDFEHMYAAIDSSRLGDAPWKCFTTGYSGEITENSPSWKRAEYEVWYRDPDTVIKNMLDNPDFDGQFDYTPYVSVGKDGQRRWNDFMSGNYAWKHCDDIYASDESTEGAMYCPIILGSDKTTVSVATGHVEYHPLYLSIGNPHNTIRRAHRNAVVPIGFLAIPKSERRHDNDNDFRKFKRQLYHTSIAAILRPLQPGMTTPVIRRCPDGHYRRVIYDLAAYIADYPEQVLVAGIVQNWCPKCTAMADNLDGPGGRRTRGLTEELLNTWDGTKLWEEYGIDDDVVPFTYDFPRADIHEMLSPDILHQLIKGTFKDHLVTWVSQYLFLEHGEAQANEILDDIDRRIAATPSFPGLRRFPHGRRFKQWTGDDSKALMKVYIPAIQGHVPPAMVQCISAFLDICYLVRRADLDEKSLNAFDLALNKFHQYRQIFFDCGVRPKGFNLPRQHSLVHYRYHIQQFGAPGGLCSSITESRHITAVKRPWRRSNHYEALGQMLLTIQRLDKLNATRADFVERGMLPPTYAPPPQPVVLVDEGHPNEGDEDVGDVEPIDDVHVTGHVVLARTPIRTYPKDLTSLATHLGEPALPDLTRRFLFDQINHGSLTSNDVPLNLCPNITTKISVFHSAVATFYAPSDESGIRGMRRERIRATPSWYGKGARYDCAFVVDDQNKPGMRGMSVVRVKLLFSFKHRGDTYPCALVEWFKLRGSAPDAVTGMWRVVPEMKHGERVVSVLHLDTFLRGAHLLPVFGDDFLPHNFHFFYSLDAFEAYYVNKFADHHIHEIIF
ncbi:hypothetical protein BD779DRAFT_1453918 [Infundibulicybe gibba]|nr:hypothetical protein BD779DRAFT_1453918 [Infundibulicybe gibba]